MSFAPLLNEREYTQNEKIVLEYFFTNTDSNIYCATNNMSNQLWAFLVGQYSRSSLSMRDRFLKLFEDASKALEKGIIEKDEYVSLDELAESIEKQSDVKLKYFEEKASNFLKKWGVDYGHNSLKDADRIRFAIEGISQVFTKVIESPFPALGDFQEKSTRYIHFGKDSLIFSPDLKKSKYYEDIKSYTEKLMDTYESQTEVVKKALKDNNTIKREDFSSDRSYENTLNAKVFDIIRYLLPSNVSTSLGASFSTRTLESHLSYMLSYPLEEVREVAKLMHTEALKLSPGLLRHVKENEFEIQKREKSTKIVEDILKTTGNDKDDGYFRGIDDDDRVKIIFEGDLDTHILASIMFENGRKYGISYDESLEIVENLNIKDKEDLMKAYLEDRGCHDRLPRALQHSTILVEFLVDFGAYRDLQRHRASSQLWQGSTGINGYDYPELIDLPGMENFKKIYDDIMTKGVKLSKEIIKENSFTSEYAAGLGHLIRTTFEMHPGQLGYVIELRTTPWGHHSYRRLFQELYRQFAELSPIFAKYINMGGEKEESSRKVQEERAEKKRKELGV